MSQSKKSGWLRKITKWMKDPLSLFREKSPRKKSHSKKTPKKAKSVSQKTAKPVVKKIPKKTTSKPAKKAVKKTASKKKVSVAKKISKKAPSKPKASKEKKVKTAVQVKPAKKEIGVFVGKITHYFPKAGACAIRIEKAELKEGAKIHISGDATDFKMIVKSIQINRIPVPSGRPGEDIGIGVSKPVAAGDSIYLI